MKRCPKCGRTFPDDNQKFCTVDGGLLVAAGSFDPNATIVNASAPLPPTADQSQGDLHTSAAPTVTLNRDTGPTSSQTFGAVPPPSQAASAPLPQSAGAPLPPPSGVPPIAGAPAGAPTKKKSKLPLILGILAILLVLGVGAAVAAFFLVIKPRLDEREQQRRVVLQDNNNSSSNENANTAPANTNTEVARTEPEFVPPADTVQLTSSPANLDGRLAEHYFDFSFYYPKTWAVDPKAGVPGATSFAKIERRLPPDFTQENFAVGWYDSKGTFAADESNFPKLVETASANLSKALPEYQKVSEGPTKVNSMDAYEFRFVSLSKGTEKGDIQLWGRVIFLPRGVEGEKTGATLSMLTTSLAPELTTVDDVGVKGQMPVILESFRFGKR